MLQHKGVHWYFGKSAHFSNISVERGNILKETQLLKKVRREEAHQEPLNLFYMLSTIKTEEPRESLKALNQKEIKPEQKEAKKVLKEMWFPRKEIKLTGHSISQGWCHIRSFTSRNNINLSTYRCATSKSKVGLTSLSSRDLWTYLFSGDIYERPSSSDVSGFFKLKVLAFHDLQSLLLIEGQPWPVKMTSSLAVCLLPLHLKTLQE